MPDTIVTPRPTRERAEAVALEGGDPDFLSALRDSARAAYQEAPWPSSSRDEAWRRTPQIDRFDPAAFALPEGPLADLHPYMVEALRGPLAGGPVLATIVTDHRGDLLKEQGAADFAWGLGQGLRRDPLGWSRVLGKVVAPGLRKWTALNTVRTLGGACIRLAANERPDGYVRVLHGVSQGSASFPRTVVRLGEGAKVTLVEEWLSADEDPCLLVPVTEVELGRDSQLTHVILQRCGERTVVQSTARVAQAQGSRYEVCWCMLGASWQKSYFETLMQGEASEARLVGLTLGQGRQHCDLQTLQDHVAPGAVSDLLYRVAVAERARSVYAGLIRVEENAQRTNAYVQNRNLLLSPQAKADSNPTLEILANDVRCTHGTTAGRIDDNQLYYCQSRGIDRSHARRLITEGFFADVVDALPSGPPRQYARELVLSTLAALVEPADPGPAPVGA
ncbi:MAG: Fe-S cluster assembly protein SufD [Candidatus Dormibacteria bacterium]